MRKAVRINTNHNTINEVSKVLEEIVKSNPTKIEASVIVGAIIRNINGFILDKNEDKNQQPLQHIGKFKNIDVYRNILSTEDYIEYS